MKFFKEEQEQLGRILYLSEKLIHKLMNYQFEHNIAELKQCVTMVCANAYAQDSSEESLEIYLYNLPAKLQGSISMKEQDASQILWQIRYWSCGRIFWITIDILPAQGKALRHFWN